MVLKYLVEWAVATVFFAKSYPLTAFLTPLFSVREQYLQSATSSFLVFVVAWSLPFLWIGVSMSVRRAADAGHPPGTGLMFLCPVLNFAFMIIYSLLPSVRKYALCETNAPAKWIARITTKLS